MLAIKISALALSALPVALSVFVVALSSRASAEELNAKAELKFVNINSANVVSKNRESVQLYEYNDQKKVAAVITWSPKRPDQEICKLNGVKCNPLEPITLDANLVADRAFTFELVYGETASPIKTQIHMFDPQLRGYMTTGESKIEKNLITTANGALLVFSPKGRLIFYRREQKDAIDFKAIQMGSEIGYVYLRSKVFHPFGLEGDRVFLDSHFQEISVLKGNFDGHDFIYLGKNHYIGIEYVAKSLKSAGCLIDSKVIEMQGSHPVRTFSGADFNLRGFFSTFTAKMQHGGQNCVASAHVNSVQRVSESKWLLSLGDSVVMYDFKKNAPVWIFGGSSDQFYPIEGDDINTSILGLIHSAEWSESTQTLTFFRNWLRPQLDAQVAAPTIVRLKLDTNAKKIENTNEFTFGLSSAYLSGSVTADGDQLSVASGIAHKNIKSREFDLAEIRQGEKTPHFTIKFLAQPAYVYRLYRY